MLGARLRLPYEIVNADLGLLLHGQLKLKSLRNPVPLQRDQHPEQVDPTVGKEIGQKAYRPVPHNSVVSAYKLGSDHHYKANFRARKFVFLMNWLWPICWILWQRVELK